MNIVQVKCQNCGANLEIDANKKVQFCNHCGGKILLEETNKTTHHEIIDKTENITNRYIDEAKITQLNMEKEVRQEKKRVNIILLLSWIASLLIFLIASLFTMDSVNFSPFQILIIIDIIVGIVVIKKRSN